MQNVASGAGGFVLRIICRFQTTFRKGRRWRCLRARRIAMRRATSPAACWTTRGWIGPPGAIGGTTPALGTFTRLSAIYDEASPATATFYPISSARNNAANRGVALGIQTRSDNNTVRGGAVQAGGNGQLFIGVPSAPYAIQINGAEGNIIIGATSTQLNFTERMILHGALVLQSGAGLDTPNTTYPKIIGGSSVMGTNSDLLLIARNSSSNGHIGFITGAAGGQAGVRMSVRADGTVHIGTWHTPAALLSVLLNDTGTNDIVNVGIIGRRSSNTPAADFGAAAVSAEKQHDQ